MNVKLLHSRALVNKAFAELRKLIDSFQPELDTLNCGVTSSLRAQILKAEEVCVENAQSSGMVEPVFFRALLAKKKTDEIYSLFVNLLLESLSSHPSFSSASKNSVEASISQFVSEIDTSSLTFQEFYWKLAEALSVELVASEDPSKLVFLESAILEATGQGGISTQEYYPREQVSRNAALVVRSVLAHATSTNSHQRTSREKFSSHQLELHQ